MFEEIFGICLVLLGGYIAGLLLGVIFYGLGMLVAGAL